MCIRDSANWVDERGQLIAAKIKKLIIPKALQHVTTRLLKTEQRTGTADNDISSVVSNGTVPEGYSVNNFLTDQNAWFLITDVPNGMKMFERVKISTNSDGDFDTGNMRFRARERYSFGCSDPLGIFGSPGST